MKYSVLDIRTGIIMSPAGPHSGSAEQRPRVVSDLSETAHGHRACTDSVKDETMRHFSKM